MAASESQTIVKTGTGTNETFLTWLINGTKKVASHILLNSTGVAINPATEPKQDDLIAAMSTLTTAMNAVAAAIKNEDAPHVSGDPGIVALAVRTDTAAARAGTDGDNSPLITDANGRLHVMPYASGGAPTLADAADVTLNNGSETAVLTSSSSRREATIVADPANTVNIRIGAAGTVSASRGVPLLPGQSITLITRAAISAFASAASQKVNVITLSD